MAESSDLCVCNEVISSDNSRCQSRQGVVGLGVTLGVSCGTVGAKEDAILHHNSFHSALIMLFNLEATLKALTCPTDSEETLTGTSPLSDDKKPCLLKQLLLHLIGNHDMEWGINPSYCSWLR